jgi:glycolate oxidase FAD binding subunit
LGVRGVTGAGDLFKSGARVVKNVTGYDLAKLLTGSYGTLAAMTSIILKVLPRPETEETIVVEGCGVEDAVDLMSLAMQSSCEVSAAGFIPGEALYLRLEGIAASVAYRRDQLAKLLGRPVQVMAAKSSMEKWKSVRDVNAMAKDQTSLVWRLSVTPSDAPGIITTLKEKMDFTYLLDWAGGLMWIETPPSEDAQASAIRAALPSGHAMLIRAPESVRASVDVFQPQPPALAALSERVRLSFDPASLFNPGRMTRRS